MKSVKIIQWIEVISDEDQAALVAFLLLLPSLTNVGFQMITCAGGSLPTHALHLIKEGVPTLRFADIALGVCQQRRSLLTLPDGHPVLMLSAHLPAFDPLALSPPIRSEKSEKSEKIYSQGHGQSLEVQVSKLTTSDLFNWL